MSDRNPNQPSLPRDAERYAELADLMGDFGQDAPVSPRRANVDPAFTAEESASLESALASVDANYPIRPREVPISSPAMLRSWQTAPGSMPRATPVASPLAPQALDAWDLRPTYNPHAQTAEEAFFPEQNVAPAISTPEVWPEQLAAVEPELLDEDAFQSVLDGLEGDILGDEELADLSEPLISEAATVRPAEPFIAPVYPTESLQPVYMPPEVQVAEAFESTVEFDPEADFDSVFEDAFENPLPDSDQNEAEYVEPEFEDIDFADAAVTQPATMDAAIAVAAGGGLAAVLGSMRANSSREVQSDATELPVASPASSNPVGQTEPLFMDASQPYDDVPVTGSLKVPDYVAPEAHKPVQTSGYDEFEVEELQPVFDAQHPASKPEVPASSQALKPIDDDFADMDFENAFDDNYNPTEELADLVGSNVEPEPLFRSSKDDDFAPMPAMPPIETPKSGRGKWVAFGALGLALIGGLAIYGSSGGSTDSAVEPAIVRADVDPVRVAPENPGGTIVPNQDRVVFNEVGNGNAVPEQPQDALIDGRQEPAIAAAPVKEADRVLNGDTTAEQTANSGTAIAPRPVQTVTVRPDGTLVINEPAVPVAKAPQAEVVPEMRPETAAAEQAMPAPTVAEAAATPLVETQVVETPVVEVPVDETALKDIAEAKVPVRVVEIKPVTQKPKVKAQQAQPADALEAVPSRPSDQPVNIVNAEAPAVPEQPAEQQVAAAEPAPVAGAYSIQIASTPSEEAATSTLRSLSNKFGSVLGGRDYTIQRAEVAGKGTVYRVRIAAGSKEDAGKLCARYKSAGGSCFVTR